MQNLEWLTVVLLLVPGLAKGEGLTMFMELPSMGTMAISVILIVLMTCFLHVWRKHIKGYLESAGLKVDAETVVRAAEAVIGRGKGNEKWGKAMEWMNERGWNVDSSLVQEAVKAAWQFLNSEMHASGEKKSAMP